MGSFICEQSCNNETSRKFLTRNLYLNTTQFPRGFIMKWIACISGQECIREKNSALLSMSICLLKHRPKPKPIEKYTLIKGYVLFMLRKQVKIIPLLYISSNIYIARPCLKRQTKNRDIRWNVQEGYDFVA